jgi:hypothetical protein
MAQFFGALVIHSCIFFPVSCLGHAEIYTLLVEAPYATSWKVMSLIFNGFFNLYNLYSRSMALGSTRPLTEMSVRNLPGVKGGQHLGLTTSPPSVSQFSRKGALTSHSPVGLQGLFTG